MPTSAIGPGRGPRARDGAIADPGGSRFHSAPWTTVSAFIEREKRSVMKPSPGFRWAPCGLHTEIDPIRLIGRIFWNSPAELFHSRGSLRLQDVLLVLPAYPP